MIFNDEQKESLIDLRNLPLSALEFMLSKTDDDKSNEKFFDSLLKLCIDAKKLKISEKILLKELEFNDDQINIIEEYFKIQNITIPANELKFLDLEWRLEAKVASRSLHNINALEPKILIKMNMENNGESKKQLVMSTNVVNLSHIIQNMEQALGDSKILSRK